VTTYDRRAFAQAFLDAHPDARHGLYYNEAYNTALREHRQRVPDGLRRLFGLTLSIGDGFMEAGLIFRQLAEARVEESVHEGLARITALNNQSREPPARTPPTTTCGRTTEPAGTASMRRRGR
jgi:hypothetical protein